MQNGEESYLSDLAISRICWCYIAAPCTPAADSHGFWGTLLSRDKCDATASVGR